MLGLVAIAFALRLIAGLLRGPDFVAEGYSHYADIARTFLAGGGLCYSAGEACANRLPLYPIFVAPFIATGTAYPWLIVVQSVIGGSVTYFTYALGELIVNRRVALIAATLAAVNPYTVVHDSAFQETALFNALVMAGLVLLIKSIRDDDGRLAAAAGTALALAVLATARLSLFIPLAVLWMLRTSAASLRRRLRLAAIVTIPIIVLPGAWMVRNWQLVGAPVMTTELGHSLWWANNPYTMRFIPKYSIDLNAGVDALEPGVAKALDAADGPVAHDRILAAAAIHYVRSHPLATARAAFRKVVAAFSGELSPARGAWLQATYALIFFPLNLLAAIGLYRAWPWRDGDALLGLMLLTFTVTTAVFWAHTSHTSSIHPVIFVYAASVLSLQQFRWRPRST